jgi:trehalose 6-phosphate phosphatase
MKHWKSPPALAQLEKFLARKPVFVFDFDGTLAPIVKVPAAAEIAPSVLKPLAALSATTKTVIVTGRAKKDVQPKIPEALRMLIIGNHGLESPFISPPERMAIRRCVKDWTKALSKLKSPGLYLEKKLFSLSVHYRLAQNKPLAKAEVEAVLKSLKPRPRVMDGKEIFNILPDFKIHKGTAVRDLQKHLKGRPVIFLGDDVNDEDVFRLPRAHVLGVRVDKAPNSKAQIFIDKQSEVASFLRYCVKHMDKRR